VYHEKDLMAPYKSIYHASFRLHYMKQVLPAEIEWGRWVLVDLCQATGWQFQQQIEDSSMPLHIRHKILSVWEAHGVRGTTVWAAMQLCGGRRKWSHWLREDTIGHIGISKLTLHQNHQALWKQWKTRQFITITQHSVKSSKHYIFLIKHWYHDHMLKGY
jgi:hypothetical protein